MSFSAGITACDLAGRWEMGVQLLVCSVDLYLTP